MPQKQGKRNKAVFDVWLRRKMAEFSFTPAQVAKSVDVSEGTVSRWLNEGRKPERKQVAALSILFGVSPADILKVTDPEEFVQTVKAIEGRQPDEIDVLAQVPELRGLMKDLAEMTPERRAAIVMLARESKEIRSE